MSGTRLLSGITPGRSVSAFIPKSITARGTSTTVPGSNRLFKNSTINFFNHNKHVLFRNVISYKYKGNAVEDVFDESTLIADNLHFVFYRHNAPSWASFGEVTWAAPSAPAGESSDGSGDYIPSLVQTDAEMVHWSLGNPNTLMDNNDHFYYDARELDLTWWK